MNAFDLPPAAETGLRRALAANGVFSGVSGLLLLAAGGPMSRLLGVVSPGTLSILGAGLTLFSLWLVRQTSRDPLDPRQAFGATVADLGWVVGSAVVLVAFSPALSSTGQGLVAGVALVVLALAVAQLVGLRRLTANHRGEFDESSSYVLSHTLEAPAHRVWDLIRQLERIGEFYPELSQVSVREDDRADTMVRSCTDRDGRSWSEEVLSMDDESRSLSLRFVTEAEDFPFPVRSMTGGWRVAETERGCEVTLWYEFTPKGGLLGQIMAAVLAPDLEDRMIPLIDNLGAVAAGGSGGSPPGASAA